MRSFVESVYVSQSVWGECIYVLAGEGESCRGGHRVHSLLESEQQLLYRRPMRVHYIS